MKNLCREALPLKGAPRGRGLAPASIHDPSRPKILQKLQQLALIADGDALFEHRAVCAAKIRDLNRRHRDRLLLLLPRVHGHISAAAAQEELRVLRALAVLRVDGFGDDLGLLGAQRPDRLHPREHRPHRKAYKQPYSYPESHIYYQLS